MQVRIDELSMCTNFSGHDLSGFGDTVTLKNGQISLYTSPWSAKNVIDRNQLKKIMQVGINEICMQTKFGGCSFSGFGDITTFCIYIC